MRKVRTVFLLALLSAAALAAGINLDTSNRFEFTDCASGGSVAQTLTSGYTYVMRVTDSDAFVCFASSASTCVSGGEKWPQGTVVLISVTTEQKSVSCRSSASLGDVIFTRTTN